MQDLSPAGLFELSFFMQVIIKYSRASIVLRSPHLNPGFYHHTAFKGLIRKGRSGEVQYLLRFRVGPDLSLRFFPSTAQGLIHSLPGHLAGSDPIYLLPGCSSGRTERTEIKRGGGRRPGDSGCEPCHLGFTGKRGALPCERLWAPQMNGTIEMPVTKHLSSSESLHK